MSQRSVNLGRVAWFGATRNRDDAEEIMLHDFRSKAQPGQHDRDPHAQSLSIPAGRMRGIVRML